MSEDENIVKRVCRELGITQRELSDILGIPPTTISGWANGEIPKMTELALNLLIENKKLKDKFSILKQAQRILNNDDL
ncbi:helix-turn-helix domain-containing protein [Campylobacter hyointestinalis]|uniref:Helix-turn-helix n=1 Tax=Campylobacter hyointestinalis subsp. hyointestinalis TaxID=91352 RepID=A0A9W5AM10_CAMHY|nr:helix-turn-helix transcriptional regulator [Campylobacter hyointestinalis]CUU74180.1 Helix-turn-helix [Campylobacter hyointestinalis subsp. hyointestinalis]CUU81982.1 Helix-turn-helix [Campylobacter hyointestinalis subsp. hyointestinalis]